MSNPNLIPSSEISIIIQGPLYKTPRSEKSIGILQSLPSLRRVYPDAEIIISTWEFEDVAGLDADHFVINKDPGGFKDINGSTRNFNRQIVSTLNGVKAASRKYVLKSRSDLLFENSFFTNQFSNQDAELFKKRVIVSNLYIRNLKAIPYLYHLSDVVSFGLKEDILDLWDIPLEKEGELIGLSLKSLLWRFSSSRFKYHPEQSLCLRWLSKKGQHFSLRYPADTSFRMFKNWIEVLTKNFDVIDFQRSGIVFPYQFFTSAYNVSSTNFTSSQIALLKESFNSPIKLKSYFFRILSGKYFYCILQPTFFLSVVSNILIKVSPKLHSKIFIIYRKLRSK